LPLPLDVQRVRFEGRITAKSNLVLAQWDRGPGTPATALAKFAPQSKECPIAEVVLLKPGLQTIRFRAQTAGGEEVPREVVLNYRPQLPLVKLIAPEEPFTFYEPAEKDSAEVVVKGKLVPPPDPGPEDKTIKAAILVNGKELPDPAEID
jgi:hypothetical protein